MGGTQNSTSSDLPFVYCRIMGSGVVQETGQRVEHLVWGISWTSAQRMWWGCTWQSTWASTGEAGIRDRGDCAEGIRGLRQAPAAHDRAPVTGTSDLEPHGIQRSGARLEEGGGGPADALAPGVGAGNGNFPLGRGPAVASPGPPQPSLCEELSFRGSNRVW